jgi:uncharacterized integral membrane protein
MHSGIFALFPMLIIMFIYLSVVVGIIVFVVITVNKFLNLKREHNDLLREIINKMDKK